MRRRLLAVLAVGALLATPLAAGRAPDPGDHYGADINDTFDDPRNLSVVVVPAAYASSIMVEDTSWVGADAARDEPGTQAVLEAIDYWAWALDHHESKWPWLERIDWNVSVLGDDASAGDLRSADIVVTSAMAGDPAPFIFHLGLGKNTLPAESLVFNQGPMTHCTVWNTGAGTRESGQDPFRLRNLAIHEFGHCLAAGHSDWCHGGNCYAPPPGDIMEDVHGDFRQCISNLNVKSVALGYHWLANGTDWKPHHDAVFVEKTDYERTCMPQSMERV